MATDDFLAELGGPEEGAEPAPDQAQIASGYGQNDNLAAILPLSTLNKIASTVIADADADYRSMSGWRSKVAEYMKLHNGDLDPVTDQENITPMHLPLVRRAVRMFHSKMFPQLYPPTGDIVILKVQSPALQEIAERCTLHMNYTLINEILEYIPSHDRGMKQCLIQGSFYEVWWFDPVDQRPCQEICLAEDVWISYTHKTDRPDLANVPRITWRKRMHQHELEAAEDNGYYVGVTKPVQLADGTMTPIYNENSYGADGAPLNATGYMMGDDTPIKDDNDSFVGVSKRFDETDGPREILEQDRMLKLPGQKRQRAVTVCVDRAMSKVLRLTFREREDVRDRRRYLREKALIAASNEANMAAAQDAHSEAMGVYQAQMDNMMLAAQQTGQPLDESMLPGQPQFAPPEPAPEPTPPKLVPWHRWTKYDCDVNPAGALGLGVSHDVAGHNKLADSVATRYVSLLTMHLLPTGIMSRQSRFMRGETQLKLGKIMESPMSPQQVAAGAGLHILQWPQPDPNTYRVLDQADQSAQEVTAFDIAMGGPGMSGETATESENRHSAAGDNISMVAQRYNRARAISLKNLAYIFSLNLPAVGVKIYADLGGQEGPSEIVVTREDYQAIIDELEVTFTCDPNLESKMIQERRAMKMWQTGLQLVTTTVGEGGPALIDPMGGLVLMRALAVQVAKALGMPKQFQRMIEMAPMPNPNGMPPEPGAMNAGGNINDPGNESGGPFKSQNAAGPPSGVDGEG